MGQSTWDSELASYRVNMIKIAFVVCFAAYVAAEAEAEADPALLYGGYAGLGYAGLGYAGLGYAGLGYGYGLAAPVANGYGISNVANTVGIAGVGPAALPAVAGGYAGAGRYVANSAGVVHVAKREAEADPEAKADAGLLYGGYGLGLGYAGLGYAGLGYAGYGHGLGAYGYSGLGYYGKRSADAEPEAKADAGLLYGGYGYGLGLGYAGLGYGSLGYAGLGYGGLGYAGYGHGLGAYPYPPCRR